MKATAQQEQMLQAAEERTNFVGSARAGTGKSTALAMVAEAVKEVAPTVRGCVAVYNKLAAIEMASRLPPGFESSTTHSLAYAAMGRKYSARMDNRARPLPPWKYGEHFGIMRKRAINDMGQSVSIHGNVLVSCMLSTIRIWCSTSSPEIERCHVVIPKAFRYKNNRELVDYILRGAKRLWVTECTNPHGTIRYSHDWYMKEWGDQVIQGQKFLGFDCFMIDEGQDSTGLILDVAKTQMELGVHCATVGDPYQAIYEWRGAMDIMSNLVASGLPEIMLTQSFRFGQAVADEGGKWLTLAGGKPDVIGAPWKETRIGPVDRDSPYAILCRTNLGCCSAIIEAYEAGLSVKSVGNLSNVVGILKSALRLRAGNTTDHAALAAFPNWDALMEYVDDKELCDDQELKLVVKIVNTGKASKLIDILGAKGSITPKPGEEPRVTVATAHSTKGMQWPQVVIGDDWTEPDPDPLTGEVTIPHEFARLAYVAVTRAEDVLDLGQDGAGLSWVDTYV